MASAFAAQLQPWEENQSPSPVEEYEVNPYETALARNTSLSRRRSPSSPTTTTTNTLLRQLSVDTSSPAWKRHPSINNGTTEATRTSPLNSNRLNRSSEGRPLSPSPSARRHPNFTMTSSIAPLPDPTFQDVSTNVSSTSLEDQGFTLPNRPFAMRSGNSSNRSSVYSQDLSSLTSEELWSMGGPDPTRYFRERPLDTVRRLSTRIEISPASGLPGDVIWPSAPPTEDFFFSPARTQSTTSIGSLASKATRRMSRSKGNRQQPFDAASTQMTPFNAGKIVDGYRTAPVSPIGMQPKMHDFASSRNSSATSLTSHAMPKNSSAIGLGNRPPSAYYSRDILSTLAPRDGGYAVASQMGNGLGAVGTMTADDRRRSTIYDDRTRMPPRAPPAKSAGMGRWSLDGGEHYVRPSGTGSANTTSSNLSGPPWTSPESSPPTDEASSRTSFLPEGASPSASTPPTRLETRDLAPAPGASGPLIPSPLSQNAHSTDLAVPNPPQEIPVPPVPAPPPKTMTPQKSQKELAKEAKEAQKVETQKLARQRAEVQRIEALRKQKEKEAATLAKDAAKRKEKEEKTKRKAEQKTNKLKSSSSLALVSPFKKSATPGVDAPALPAGAAALVQSSTPGGTVPFPQLAGAGIDYQAPLPNAEEARRTTASMPLERIQPPVAVGPSPGPHTSPQTNSVRPQRNMFGTLKKRLSLFGRDDIINSQGSYSNSLPATSNTSTSARPQRGSDGLGGPRYEPRPSSVHGTADPSIAGPLYLPSEVTNVASDLPSGNISKPPPMPSSDPMPVGIRPGPATPEKIRPRSDDDRIQQQSAPVVTPSVIIPPPLRRTSSNELMPVPINASPLTQTVSNDPGASSGSAKRSSVSLRGPRPMPYSPPMHKPRVLPATEQSSENGHGSPVDQKVALQAPLSTPSTSDHSSGSNPQSGATSSSTFGDSHDLSPFTSDGSRTSSMTSNELQDSSGVSGRMEAKHREGFQTSAKGTPKSSNETINAGMPRLGMPVLRTQ